ncbi:MAG TPA: choice-of-anchor D domain-containing protein [Terriglobales bacterium]|nr:choice-of-anchor D domain-containing protein [Terriglobales bacterium]
MHSTRVGLMVAVTITLAACGGGSTGVGASGGGGGATAAPAATFAPTSLTFSAQTVATTSAAQTITLTNGGNAALAISSLAATGDFAQTNTCGTSLAAGANCAISVTFTPTTSGARSGAITLVDNAAGSPQSAALSGTGAVATAVVQISPSSLTFAAQTVGSTSPVQKLTLTNTGSATLSITSVAASGDFGQTNTCGTSLAAGANCLISVTFTPTSSGTRTGAITLTDSAGGSPQSVVLTGAGAAPAMTLTSFAPANPPPGATLTLQGTGFDPTASPLVVFTEAGGFSAAVPPTSVTATTITVAAPPWVDPASGAFSGGSYSLSVSQGTSSTATLPGLQITTPPALASPAGRLTVDLLQSTRNYISHTLETGVSGSSIETTDLDAALVNEVAALDTILPGLIAVQTKAAASYTIGTYAGQAVTITPAVLAQSDQAILTMLQAQAALTEAPVRAGTSPGCMAAAAGTMAQDYSNNASPSLNDPDAWYAASQLPPCATPQALNTSLSVVLGSGAVALGVLALTLPADAALAALALPTAAILSVTLVAAGGAISVGGALGQASATGKGLVESGLAQLEELQQTLLLKGASLGVLTKLGVDHPDGWIGLAGALLGGHAVMHALVAAPPNNGGTSSGTTFQLSISTAGTGKGGVGSYPGALSCGSAGGSCAAAFATGTTVLLNAVAASGSAFTGWSGACSGTGACTVTMSSDQSVTATFGPPPGDLYIGSANANFSGTLTSDAGCVFGASVGLNVALVLVQNSDGSVSGSASVPANVNIAVLTDPSGVTCTGTPFSTTAKGPVTDASGHLSATFSNPNTLQVAFVGNLVGTTISGSAAFTEGFTITNNDGSKVKTSLSGTLPSITLTKQ